jgi:hypothetical protein
VTRRALVGCEVSGEVREALAATGYWDEVWSADILPTERPVMTFVAADNRWVNVPDRPEDGPRVRHYQGDVRDLFKFTHPVNRVRSNEIVWADLNGRPDTVPLWEFAMLHPPCDHLALAGARYWPAKREPRLDPGSGQFTLPSVQDEAAAFFMEMASAPARYVAVENPVGDMKRRYRAPDQVVEPWWFGDPLSKRTCLWTRGLPPLVADRPVEPTGRVATGGGSHRTDTRNGRTAMNRAHEDRRGRAFRKTERSRTLPGFARAIATQWTAFIELEQAGACVNDDSDTGEA